MFDILKSVPKSKDLTQPNRELEKTIEIVKSAYPNRFLQPHELKHRKFLHEPATYVPHESYVYPLNTHEVPKPARKRVAK